MNDWDKLMEDKPRSLEVLSDDEELRYEAHRHFYSVSEMDDWLNEKVKPELDKLETIKTACEKMKGNITEDGKPANAAQLVVWNIADAILKIVDPEAVESEEVQMK